MNLLTAITCTHSSTCCSADKHNSGTGTEHKTPSNRTVPCSKLERNILSSSSWIWVFPNYSQTVCREREETRNRDVVTHSIIKLQLNQVEMNSIISPMVFTLSIPALPELKILVWGVGHISLSLDFSDRHKDWSYCR